MKNIFFYLSGNHYNYTIIIIEFIKVNNIMAQIKNPAAIKLNRLFSGIPDVRFNFKDKNYLEVKEGEVIYSKGDKSEYIYLVLNGRIKFKIYENPRQPKVFLVSKNEFFGEKEL
ncbi:MAG: hypothetical protein EHM47_17205, partial [Ignavibacteriales bacterium]